MIDCVTRWNTVEYDVVCGTNNVVYSKRKQIVEIFLVFSLDL
jgi:hypothetical protein